MHGHVVFVEDNLEVGLEVVRIGTSALCWPLGLDPIKYKIIKKY